jgi:hypothetical protein
VIGNALAHGAGGCGSNPGNDLGQVVYAHVPLSPSRIIWYRRKLGSKRQVMRYTGPVSRTLGFVHCRLKGQEKEMSASPMGLRPSGLRPSDDYFTYFYTKIYIVPYCTLPVFPQHNSDKNYSLINLLM